MDEKRLETVKTRDPFTYIYNYSNHSLKYGPWTQPAGAYLTESAYLIFSWSSLFFHFYFVDHWMMSKRLNDSERLEIIAKLQKHNPPSKWAVAHEYNVSEGAIRKLWSQK